MTTQSARDTQRQATMDLFAAFANSLFGDLPPLVVTSYLGAARTTLLALSDPTDPLAADVLDAIHAERRRRLSAATREERRG